MASNYKISVIVPIYNVERYLREALDSVLQQSLGFQKNIQLILINDGSTDGSEAICLEYKQRFPENITYIYKENGGVSSARNMGFDLAKGKYVTFLDPDDKWEKHSFRNAYRFFEKNYDKIDVLAARIQFFEANTNFHSLDYKFKKGTRVADLTSEEELYSVQSTAATTFIKREAIGDLRFDSKLQLGEDSTFINKMMLKKRAYGLINEAMYFYRRRASGTSAVNTQLLNKSFYTNSLVYYHLELFRYSKELYGEVIPYIQSMVAYDIYWRLANPEYAKVLDKEEQQVYFERLHTIFSQIDDKILLNHPIHKAMTKKSEAMEYKYGINLFESLTLNDETGELRFGEIPLLKVVRNKTNCCQVVTAEVQDGKFVIDMLLARWILNSTKEKVTLVFKFGGKEVIPEMSEYRARIVKSRDGDRYYYNLFHCEYPLDKLKKGKKLKMVPYLRFGEQECNLSMSYGKFVPTSNRFKPIYQFFGKYAVKSFRTSIQIFYPHNKRQTQKQWERMCLAWLCKRKLFDAALTRVRFYAFRKLARKKGKIWLISDRIDNAGDNGEVLFKYICEHKPEGVRPIFVIGSVAKEEVKARLRAIGEVILAEDKRYPYYFLAAEKIISSSAGEFTINPFDKDRYYFVDLFRFQYYFMNHGVNCGDCSTWLNRFNKNIHIFFTTGVSERQNIIDRDYNYTPEQVVITGLARFDALYTDTKKQLLILPTWRRAYRECYDEKTSSIYFDGFKETAYYRFYNGLMNDERLLEVMRRKGYTGLFCLHPIFMKQSVDFEQNDVFRVNEGFVDYNKVFAESAVMVTDYSTIAFDFAYLSKPIVYTQFDKEEFYENQIYNECFDYEKEGFGPICTDLDSAVQALSEIIENDCENQYMDRVESFFVHRDKNNAKRILEAVLANDEKNNKQ